MKQVNLFLVVAMLGLANAVIACPHVPKDYTCSIAETTKQALIFHDGKFAHLIVSTSFQADGPLPKSMAWIIPLPSLPVSYKEEDGALFRTLFEAFEKHAFYRSVAKNPGPGIKVHEPVRAGSYLIHPIEILSRSAGTELNTWLEGNGYNPVPAESQRRYLRPGAVFLAVNFEGLSGNTIEAKPLHIIYPAKCSSLPLGFSAGSGVFDVYLYTLTEKYSNGELCNFGFAPQPVSWDMETGHPPAGLVKLLRELGGTGRYLSRFYARDFNAPGRWVGTLTEDPSVTREEVLSGEGFPSLEVKEKIRRWK